MTFSVRWPLAVLLAWLGVMGWGAVYGGSPETIHLERVLAAPSAGAWLGSDDLGRDILARLMSGAQVSFGVAAGVTVVTLGCGTLLGVLSGYCGGWADRVLMGVTEVFLAFPGILLAIAFAAVLGPGVDNLVLALCLTGWVGYARLARGQALALRARTHVQAALVLGASRWRILWRHMIPLMVPLLLVEATHGFAGLIIAEASLSFLGLGIQPPHASWGGMLRDGVRYLVVAPHYVLATGLSLMSLVLAINRLGDTLRDSLDVREKE